MAETPYTKYKQRLASQMQTNSSLRNMNKSIARFSQPFQELNNQMQSSLQQGNATLGAKLLATIRGQQQVHGMNEQMYLTGQEGAEMRRQSIQDKITDISLQEDAWKQQQKEQKRQAQTGALRTGAQILGAAAGLALGGVGSIALGSAAGSLVGGAVGIDKSGNITAKPEQWDTGMMMQGATEIAGSLVNQANEKKVSGMYQRFSQDMPKIAPMMEKMSANEFNMFYPQIISAMQRGDMDAYEALLKPYYVGQIEGTY
jgi:hypothetical protein